MERMGWFYLIFQVHCNFSVRWYKKTLNFLYIIFLFIYFWQCCVFVPMQAFLQLWQSGPTLSLQCAGFIVVASFAAEHRL